MLLSELVEAAIGCAQGNCCGHCVVCGRKHSAGFPPEFSGAFTSWQHLQDFPDAVLCPACHEMLNNPQWRRSHWLLTGSGVRWLTRAEIPDVVRHPPPPPFALYTTASFKKHGWIVLQQHVNLGTHDLRWAWDEQVFIEARSVLLEMLVFVEGLRARGWKVKELLREWEIEHIAQNADAYRMWQTLRWNPAWKWVVWISRAKEAEQIALPLNLWHVEDPKQGRLF